MENNTNSPTNSHQLNSTMSSPFEEPLTKDGEDMDAMFINKLRTL